MRTLVVVALVALVALTGCGPKKSWAKPGGTIEEWRRDRYACAHENQEYVCYMGSCSWQLRGRMFDQCMRASGWELTDASKLKVLDR